MEFKGLGFTKEQEERLISLYRDKNYNQFCMVIISKSLSVKTFTNEDKIIPVMIVSFVRTIENKYDDITENFDVLALVVVIYEVILRLPSDMPDTLDISNF